MSEKVHLYINIKHAEKFDEICQQLKATTKSECLEKLIEMANITAFYREIAVNAILSLINIIDGDEKKKTLAKILQELQDIV